MPNDDLSRLLSSLHLASPALPVGGFAYSQGLEQAVEDKWVYDEETAAVWITDMLCLCLAQQEFPLWLACHQAVVSHDAQALTRLNEQLFALRETAEARLESLQMGQSLVKIEQPDQTEAMRLPMIEGGWTYTAAHAARAARSGLDAPAGLATYAWSWTENQVLSAVKLVPLGQTAGQSLLERLKPRIMASVTAACRQTPDSCGTAAIGLAITSSRHESQYSRLFRS